MGRVRKPVSGGHSAVNPELKLIGVGVFVIAIGLAWWAYKDKSSDGEDPGTGLAASTPGADGPNAATSAAPKLAPYALSTPAYGPETAPAVLIKYTDFQ